MYQGCNKTALTSLNSIAEGFYELLQEKEYSKITASEICKKSGVSRQTFYSLFSSKENIISFILSKEYQFDPNEQCSCHGRPTLEELSKGFSRFIVQKGDFIELLERNGILYLMDESLYSTFINCDGETPMNYTSESSVPCAMVSCFMASGLTAIAKYYVQNRSDISSEQLESMIYNLFSGQYIL